MVDAPTPRLDTPLEELLDRILATGRDIHAKAQSGEIRESAAKAWREGEETLAAKLGMEADEGFRKKARVGAGVGALALLLASRGRRKRTGLLGLGALGALAFGAYKANGDKLPTSADEVIGLFKGRKAEERSVALLTAMVAAARVDGTVSDAERAVIAADAGDAALLESILAADPDAKEVAAMADSPQAAREIYAVSARVAEGLNPAERNYLDELAMALDLDPETAARIETDVRV